eukprot:TRINITY_DN2665_c0_g1_i1.p1 TRINITY_DN2665_c0_g1~~TRINITY_DN2665_c0_g1_i1.p1  ORF type:complete len:663 (+),score=79.22 TRINITY_DN2665_c0_g1_i1:836-2824(+)
MNKQPLLPTAAKPVIPQPLAAPAVRRDLIIPWAVLRPQDAAGATSRPPVSQHMAAGSHWSLLHPAINSGTHQAAVRTAPKPFDLAKQVDLRTNETSIFGVGDTVLHHGAADPPAALNSELHHPPRIGQIIGFSQDVHGAKWVTLKLYCRPTECALPPSSIQQRFHATGRAAVRMGLWPKSALTDGLHERELLATSSTSVVPLACIRGHAHMYSHVPPAHKPLKQKGEFLLRCKWDSATQQLDYLTSEELKQARCLSGAILVGPEHQAVVPALQITAASKPSAHPFTEEVAPAWGGSTGADEASLQAYLDAARAAEVFHEGMVVKFKTCHQTWGRIAASSAASPAASNANTQCPMVPVEIEGSTLMVPRANIIGHFSEDIALDVLQSVGRDSVRALRQLADPRFCYNPLMHWPAEALAKLPQLQKGAARRMRIAKARAWESVPDGPPGAEIDLAFVRKHGPQILNCTAKAAMELVLRCPPPHSPKVADAADGSGGGANSRIKLDAGVRSQLRFLRAVKVCLLPVQYEAFERVIGNIITGQYTTEDAKQAAIRAALLGRQDLEALFTREVIAPRHAMQARKQQRPTKRRKTRSTLVEAEDIRPRKPLITTIPPRPTLSAVAAEVIDLATTDSMCEDTEADGSGDATSAWSDSEHEWGAEEELAL